MWSRQLGPRVRFGPFGALTTNQAIIAVLGGTLALGILSMGAHSVLALPAAILVATATVALVTVRYKGMPAANWTGKAAAYVVAPKTWRARPVGHAAEQLPRELANVRIITVRDRAAVVGLLQDDKALVAVAPLELHSLGLFDPTEQARRLDAFQRILDDLGRDNDAEHRVELLARHTPRQANEELAYIRAHVQAPEDSRHVQSMMEVVSDTAVASHEDQFHVVVRQTAGKDVEGSAARLVDRTRILLDRLEQADIAIKTTRRLLEPREVARLVKDSYDPFGRHIRDELERTQQQPGTDPAAAWPDHARRRVDCYETDQAVHVTLWMRGWPALQVGPGWLRPLTLRCDVPAMIIATVLKPDDRSRAIARIRRKRTRSQGSRIFRQRHGQDETVEHEANAQFLERQERELADGATAWWWETYVTVSARNDSELQESLRKVESACVECGLTPVQMRFAHASAFTFTLPLGRGLDPDNSRL